MNRCRWFVFNNVSCVKCGVVLKEMLRIGSIIFCRDCGLGEFKSDDPVKQERKLYLKWVKIWENKL